VDAPATNSNPFPARPRFRGLYPDAFRFQAIQAEASTKRGLGLSLRAIGAALGADEKTVRKALAGLAS
jgi:hypothetical protein